MPANTFGGKCSSWPRPPMWEIPGAVSAPHECQQRGKVTRVSLAERVQIALANSRAVWCRTPSEGPCTVAHQQHVSHHAGTAPVAIGKWMDEGQAMMQANCLLIECIAFVFLPSHHVVKQLSGLHGDLMRGYTDVPLSVAELPGPRPDLAKHALVQTSHEVFTRYHDCFAPDLAMGPAHALVDVRAFGIIQVTTRGYPGQLQSMDFIRIQRSLALVKRAIQEVLIIQGRSPARARCRESQLWPVQANAGATLLKRAGSPDSYVR